MKNNRIPKAKITDAPKSKIVKPHLRYTPSAISFSFEALERTEFFNLDCTCANWASELFEMLKEMSKLNKDELLSGKYSKSTYRVHNHANANPPSPLPVGVELKDCYQLRIAKSKGGIHGVFYDNIFYVIWLDPLHNMYPNKNYGGLKKIKPPSTCCMDRDEKLLELERENQKLKEENDYWESEISKL